MKDVTETLGALRERRVSRRQAGLRRSGNSETDKEGGKLRENRRWPITTFVLWALHAKNFTLNSALHLLHQPEGKALLSPMDRCRK